MESTPVRKRGRGRESPASTHRTWQSVTADGAWWRLRCCTRTSQTITQRVRFTCRERTIPAVIHPLTFFPPPTIHARFFCARRNLDPRKSGGANLLQARSKARCCSSSRATIHRLARPLARAPLAAAHLRARALPDVAAHLRARTLAFSHTAARSRRRTPRAATSSARA